MSQPAQLGFAARFSQPLPGLVTAIIIGLFVGLAIGTGRGVVLLAAGAAMLAGLIGLRIVGQIVARPAKGFDALAALSLTAAMTSSVVPQQSVPLLIAVVFVAATILLPRTSTRQMSSAAVALAAYLALTALLLLRGASAGQWGSPRAAATLAFTCIAITWFVYAYVRAAPSPTDGARRLGILALAPGIFAAANLAVHYVGAYLPIIVIPEAGSIAAGEPASILRAIGMSGALREQLPLSMGVNSMGAIAAAGIVLSGYMIPGTRGLARAGLVTLVACSVATAALSDSRAALLLAVVILLIAPALPKARGARGLALLLPLSPAILVLVLGSLANTQLSSSLSRNGDDFATGTGRTELWTDVWDSTLRHPVPAHLIGYGANGQVASGAYASYVGVFGEREDDVTFTTHNLYIQTILDAGYLGLIALLAVVALAIGRIADTSRAGTAVALAIIAVLLAGMTEALPAIYFSDTLILFLILLAGAAAAPVVADPGSAGPSGPSRHASDTAHALPR